MPHIGDWELSQQNEILFPLVDSNNTEVSGLGTTFVLRIRKVGGAFVASAGTKAEISDGVYRYVSTAAESDTVGPVFIIVTGVGIIQQNLEYVVKQRTPNAIEFTYTVTDSVTTNPVPGVEVWITTDITGNNIIWRGTTDAFGVARDVDANLPFLDAGTYYFWKQLAGFLDDQGPDTEIVS